MCDGKSAVFMQKQNVLNVSEEIFASMKSIGWMRWTVYW